MMSRKSSHTVSVRMLFYHKLHAATLFFKPSSILMFLQIMRTIKFLTGISVCRYIVSPQWIEKSHEEGKYLGTLKSSSFS